MEKYDDEKTPLVLREIQPDQRLRRFDFQLCGEIFINTKLLVVNRLVENFQLYLFCTWN